MKKRILLMIVFGLSIAPAVFADGGLATGELKMSQMGDGASLCTGTNLDNKNLQATGNDSSSLPASGRSRASGAR